MSGNSAVSPIEDALDDVLRGVRADPRTVRRLLDEAADHLYSTAAELEEAGMSRHDAELEAVRRLGPIERIGAAVYRRSVRTLVVETARAAVLLAGCGLFAVGLSGIVALLMNVLAGRSFVGGETVFSSGGSSVTEVADDAVVLRGLAGVLGVVVLVGYVVLKRRFVGTTLLPPGLVDALGAAAFAAGAVGLVIACVDQATQTGATGVGFTLSGVVIAVPATIAFCMRAVHAFLPRTRSGAAVN